jgi:hypothetical protein
MTGAQDVIVARLRVTEEVGIARSGEVVRCGVALPPGAVRDAAELEVRVGGSPVPHQVLTTRADRSGLRWAAIALPLSVGALGTVEAEVVRRRPAVSDRTSVSSAPAAGVERLGDGSVRLSTGATSAVLHVSPFRLEGAASAGVVLVDRDGVRHPAFADHLEVVQPGPLLAQVLLAGRYAARPVGEEDAAQLSSWAFRATVTAVAGAAGLDLDVALVVDTDPPEDEIRSWAVEVATPEVASGTCGVFATAHRSPTPFTVSHRGEGHPRGIFATSQVVGGTDWVDASDEGYLDRWEWSELHGRQAANWVVARWGTAERDAVTVAVQRFAEHHPSDLAVLPAGVAARFWPEDAGPLRMTQGAARTRRVRLVEGSSTRAGMVVDSPLVPHQVDALGTGATPRILPYLPAQYPNLESHIREELSGWYQSGQSLGFHDFGDSMQGIERGPRTGYSANNEHDALLALTMHWLRTGERAYHDSAQAYADHLCDVDLIHHSTVWAGEVGGLRAHGRAHVHYVDARTPDGPVRTSIDTGHLWTDGLVLFGQLTGEQRYLDAAVQVADCVVGLTRIGWTRPEPGPRNSGWPLQVLTSVGRATGDSRYVDAAVQTAKSALAAQARDGRWLMRLGLVDDYCAWQNAVLLVGLARLLELEDSAEVRAAFLAGSRALLDLGRNPDGTFVYLQRFDYRWANRSAFVREALALAFDATGNEEFLRAGLAGGDRWYRPRGARPALSNDIAEWRGHLPFLARAHDVGLLRDMTDAG